MIRWHESLQLRWRSCKLEMHASSWQRLNASSRCRQSWHFCIFSSLICCYSYLNSFGDWPKASLANNRLQLTRQWRDTKRSEWLEPSIAKNQEHANGCLALPHLYKYHYYYILDKPAYCMHSYTWSKPAWKEKKRERLGRISRCKTQGMQPIPAPADT